LNSKYYCTCIRKEENVGRGRDSIVVANFCNAQKIQSS
jgi:hypothetical protein